jgi:membrane protein DedA with SNARE-associated domain
VWFTFITFLAYRAGSEWEVLYGTIVRSGKIVAIIATAIVLLALAIYFVRRRKSPPIQS